MQLKVIALIPHNKLEMMIMWMFVGDGISLSSAHTWGERLNGIIFQMFDVYRTASLYIQDERNACAAPVNGFGIWAESLSRVSLAYFRSINLKSDSGNAVVHHQSLKRITFIHTVAYLRWCISVGWRVERVTLLQRLFLNLLLSKDSGWAYL